MNQKNLSAERKTENLKFYSQKNVFKIKEREFPGGPMVRTPHFHCRGHGFNPWLQNQAAQHGQKKN